MASRKAVREFIELMKIDGDLGCRIDGAVYTVRGNTGKYLIVQKTTQRDSFIQAEIEAVYITDFVQLVYNAGSNAKAVRA